ARCSRARPRLKCRRRRGRSAGPAPARYAQQPQTMPISSTPPIGRAHDRRELLHYLSRRFLESEILDYPRNAIKLQLVERKRGRCMSKAFIKETDESEEQLPETPGGLPPGSKNYITPDGFRRLQDELNHLSRTERPRVVETVAWAAGNGDRSENGDYIYGK